MAELVDARDLKSLGAQLRAGSIPAPGTTENDIPTKNIPVNSHLSVYPQVHPHILE